VTALASDLNDAPRIPQSDLHKDRKIESNMRIDDN
jgi:hypothetical protein